MFVRMSVFVCMMRLLFVVVAGVVDNCMAKKKTVSSQSEQLIIWLVASIDVKEGKPTLVVTSCNKSMVWWWVVQTLKGK